MAKYQTGEALYLNDLVSYAGRQGRIVFIVEDAQYSEPFRQQEWEYLKKGIGLQMDDGTLYNLDEVDEDLLLVSRGNQ